MSVFNFLRNMAKAWNDCPLKDPGNAGTIQVRQAGMLHLRSAGAETRTLPRPASKGTHLFIDMEADGGDITLTVTGGINEDGDTTFVFSDPQQFLYLVSVYESLTGTYAWRKISDYATGNLTPTEANSINGLTATAAELNTMHLQTLTTGAAAGITGGPGTIYKNSVQLSGGIYYTRILIDITGLQSSTTDLDIIGQGVSAAHIGQITAAQNGTLLGGQMTCLEVPVTGVTDIDVYWATEATGKFDDAVSGLTETVLLTQGGAWTLALQKAFADPVGIANGYIYLCNGAAGTVGTYTAGKFLIELYGT